MCKQLRLRIRVLKAEIGEFQSSESVKLYGLTPEVERVVAKVISEGNGHRLYWLIKPLQLADFTDLIQRHSDIERRLLATVVGQNFGQRY